MSRKGWLPCALEGEPGAGTWVARNQLALRFQKDHPAGIAIVRYEDLVSDPKIFGSLCKSLGVHGTPVFREDRGSGRSDLPLLCPASDRGRHRGDIAGARFRAQFQARSIYNVGNLLRGQNSRGPRSGRRQPQSRRRRPNGKRASQLPNQRFRPTWRACFFGSTRAVCLRTRDASSKRKRAARFACAALADGQSPFCIPFLNGQSALFFPASKATERLLGEHGLLRFVVPATGKCPLVGDSFSVCALIKPHIPPKPHRRQERTVVVRIHSGDANAEFILEWDRALRASRAILRTNDRYGSVATERSSHPHQQWRMIYFQLQDGNDSQLLISADGIESIASLTAPAAPLQFPPEPGWTIELGGSEADPGALFYGAIAEVILFGRRLIRTEQFAIAGYLKQKYRL